MKYLSVFFALVLVGLMSCKKSDSAGESRYQDAKAAPNPPKKQIPDALANSTILMAELPKKLEPFLEKSVEQGWSLEKWRDEFGEPTSIRKLSETLMLIEYHDKKFRQTGGCKVIVGVNLWLEDRGTNKWEWHFLSYGQ